MNIILTTKCSKGCSFCFARDKNKKIEEFSLENIKKLLDMIPAPQPFEIKLAGGEPTEHARFCEIIDELTKRELNYLLITNGLFESDKILNKIISSNNKNSLKGILINSSELNRNNNLEKFKKNYLELFELSQKTDFGIACSLTLNRDLDPGEEIEYLNWLISEIPISNLRISIDFNGKNITDSSLISSFSHGDKILSILEICGKNDIRINGDCIVYPCMFSNYSKLLEWEPLFNNLKYKCTENNIPFDIFPDMSFCHCYAAHILGGNNILEFDSIETAIKMTAGQKVRLESQKDIPPICKICEFFLNNRCASLCLGCTEINPSSEFCNVTTKELKT